MRASRGLSFTSAIAVGLSAVLLLGACTPEETEPTPSASPTVEEPTPTPTPTTPPEAIAPERPAEMAEISVAGAEAAASYFLTLYPYVYATGDLVEWRLLSDPGCNFCTSVITNVEAQVAMGNTSSGGMVDITGVQGLTLGEGFSVTAEFVQSPSATLDADGMVVEDFPATKSYRALMGLDNVNGSWVIRGVQHEVVNDAP